MTVAETAVQQIPRLVELMAWLSQRDSGKPVSYREAGHRLGVAAEAVRGDLDALVDLSDEFKPWLASLSVAITSDGFLVESRGSFRRPLRLTGDEALALVIGLLGVRGGKALAGKLGATLDAAPPAAAVEAEFGLGPSPSAHLEGVLAAAREARDGHRKLEILYCASAGEPAWRVVHPHQVVQAAGRWYVIAWCEKVKDFRRFRADRVLDARLLVQDFRPQVLFKPVERPEQLLRADEVVTARVAFSERIARWLKERYPEGREEGGRYVVTFKVADAAWFVREVLQYGAEAEVLEPEGLREAVKRVVG